MASKRKQNVFILEVNSLDLSEVEIGFGLKKVNDINWAQFRTPFEIADCCRKSILKASSLKWSLILSRAHFEYAR